jgi:hypothetical protein
MSIDAAVKGAQDLFNGEECALSMVQRSSYAAVKDARIMLSREECARGTVQRSNFAAL